LCDAACGARHSKKCKGSRLKYWRNLVCDCLEKSHYDLVAATALVAAIATGIVSPDQAFKGFSDDIVIIVASALVVSAAVARSGVIERVVRRLGPYLLTIDRQVIALVASVTLLSAFIKNIGHAALSLHQEYRRARHAHADRVSACAAHQNFSVFAADADVKNLEREPSLGPNAAQIFLPKIDGCRG
jgi:Citrate transporter